MRIKKNNSYCNDHDNDNNKRKGNNCNKRDLIDF